MTANSINAPPGGRLFYALRENDDGTLDVFLCPDDRRLVVRGVEPFDGVEEDIRARYDAWCEAGEEVVI